VETDSHRSSGFKSDSVGKSPATEFSNDNPDLVA
jgi:hypothetical protein